MRAERPSPEPAKAARTANVFALRRSRKAQSAWIVEMAILFALLLVLDQAMRPSFALLDVAPHPFWAPVIAMAALYGLMAGLTTAATATLLLAWTAPALSPAMADHFLQWMQFWKEPILWLLAALALGLHCDREAAQRLELEARAVEAEARSETIAAYATTLRSQIGRLERDVALAASKPADPTLHHDRPMSEGAQ